MRLVPGLTLLLCLNATQQALAGYGTESISDGAPAFSAMTKIIQAPAPDSRWFVLEKTGRIMAFSASNPSAATQWWQFSVDTAGENGLLSMAFHPDYPATPEVFVYYVDASGSRLARMRLDNTTTPVSPDIDILLTLTQNNDRHNGGDLAFDSAGYLYWSLGDDLDGNLSQNPGNLYGSILRLGLPVYPATSYTIPASNPFSANGLCGPAGPTGSNCPEVYAWGFRNPWRISIDGNTVWVGDVGEADREEVDIVQTGGNAADNNYGWPCFEGNLDTGSGSVYCQSPPPFRSPALDYTHSEGSSITGGYVYRGSISALSGRYIFADFISGRLWAMQWDGKEELLDGISFITSLALGNDNEIYITDGANGKILRLTSGVSVDIDIDYFSASNTVHPLHNGSAGSPGGLNDPIPVVVFGQSLAAGDPQDFDTDLIDIGSVRFGPDQAAISPGSTPVFNFDFDGDQIDDAGFEFLTGDTGISCWETSATIVGETNAGEVFTGSDFVTPDCNAACH